jgi:ABC-type glycerol-3-phosphate transport system substrate-binding protein
MSKRKVLLGFLALLAVALMAMTVPMSQTRAQDAATATPAPTATPIVVDAGTGSTQLIYWNGLTGGDGSTMNAMVENFVKENPDISVHTESYDWNTMFQKLQAAFVAGEPPDVFVLHTQEIPQFQKLGILAESDDLLDSGGGPLPAADFPKASFDATMVDGKHYGILLDNHGFGTWVNLNLFKNAGVDENTPAPKNAQEFIDLATKLTLDANGKHPNEDGFDVNNVTQWGTGIDWVRVQFQSWLYQFGGDVISADGKTATINSEAGQKALQFMYDMIYKYHIAPDPATTNGYNAFQAQKIAIMPTGTWFRNVLVDQHPEIKWTVWPMIQVGDKPATWASAHVLFISSTLSGPKLDAAKKFIVWLSNNDIQWAASGQVPARISSQQKLDEKTYPSNIVIGKSFQEFAHFEPQNPDIIELQNAYDPQLTAALNNQKSVKQALDDANAAIQAVLDRQSS